MHKRLLPIAASAAACAVAIAAPALAQDSPETAVKGVGAPGTAATVPTRIGSPEVDRFPLSELGIGARPRRAYSLSRWSEDWSFLRDPAKRTDRLDPLKYIPIAGDGATYLTLSGEERLRIEGYDNPGLRAGPGQKQELIRTFVGADLHLGEHVRVFGEIASGQQFGSIAPNANERNDLYIQQLFGEVKGRVAGADAGVMVGRMHFYDGPLQLVSTRENNNIQTSLQGVRAYANWSRFRIDAFDLRFVDLGQNFLDDEVSHSERFKGVVTSFAARTGKNGLYVDPFYYRYENDARRWGLTTAAERRNYYGLRVHGTLGPAAIDWSGAYQDGQYGDRPIRAWTASLVQTIPLSTAGWKPVVGFHADAGSGGGAYGKGALRNAEFLYTTMPYFNDSKFFGPTNLALIAPTLTLSPLKRVTIRTEYSFLRRIDQQDAVYSGTKAAYGGTQTVRGHDVGELARLRVAWTIDQHFSVAGTYEHAFAGSVLEKAGYGDSNFGALQFGFKF